MADGILTQAEETLLRQFRDRLALDSANIDRKAAAQLERASTDRLVMAVKLTHMQERERAEEQKPPRQKRTSPGDWKTKRP